MTEGFSFTELNGLRRLCKNERIHIKDMCNVIDLYKYGIKDNPWNKLSISELKTAEEDFRKRVKGQDYAIVKTLDIIKRAVTGMSGVQTASHGKPKGVLFLQVRLVLVKQRQQRLWRKSYSAMKNAAFDLI